MKTDITIPTCKTHEEIAPLIEEIRATATGEYRLFASCQPVYAAANRNICLNQVESDYVIMIDDDVCGFPTGWNEKLVQVLVDIPKAVMVSARLMAGENIPGQMLGNPLWPGDDSLQTIKRQELPTACIAIRNDGMRFDEGYVGSGWEDTDLCARLRGVYADGLWIVHNGVQVIHKNEQKFQGENFRKNQLRYQSIWGKHKFHAPID